MSHQWESDGVDESGEARFRCAHCGMLSSWAGARYACSGRTARGLELAEARALLAAARKALRKYQCEIVRNRRWLLMEARACLARYRSEIEQKGNQSEAPQVAIDLARRGPSGAVSVHPVRHGLDLARRTAGVHRLGEAG